ncbi:MAG TPA: collagen-like protein [Oligoflexus sp.]|uniref:collagen-like triple helix repeat-containing protein n=1 Tax=Oligoflexus sp. TaxID=1971216 RepID=UPI002D2F4AB7|nr:collagen-like protein [Oligoflexus sp.]HYX37798.1 collagen-like protein [Oligoflexus sp.]
MRAANHLLFGMTLLGLSIVSCAKKDKKDSELESLTQIVATTSALPTCSRETMSQVYWVEEQSKIFVCNGSTFVEIAGAKGEQGEKGEDGETGPEGSPANSGVWVFDKDGKAIGVLMDARLGLILFTNGGFARINLQTGAYAVPVVLDGGTMTSSSNLVCRFTDISCAGTCYMEEAVPRGAVMRTSVSTFVVANGDEELVTGLTTKRFGDPNGTTCHDLGDFPLDGYAITKPYSFPEGITLPLKTPLSFGFKTEE